MLYWFPVQRCMSRSEVALNALRSFSCQDLLVTRVSGSFIQIWRCHRISGPPQQPLRRITPIIIGLLCDRPRIITGDTGKGVSYDYPAKPACFIVFGAKFESNHWLDLIIPTGSIHLSLLLCFETTVHPGSETGYLQQLWAHLCKLAHQMDCLLNPLDLSDVSIW